MPKIRLSDLPGTLKAEIFSKVEPKASLKFLKTTVELRHFILNNGPFPRKIKAFEMVGGNQKISESSELIVDFLKLTVRTGSQKYEFLVAGSREITEDYIGILAQDFSLFKNIHHAQELSLRLSNGEFAKNRPAIRICEYLANFRSLQQVGLNDAKFSSYALILAKIKAQIINQIKIFNINCKEDIAVGRNSELCEFISRCTNDCKEILLIDLDGMGSGPDLYAALQMTHFTDLVLRFQKGAELWTTIGAILENPLASRNSKWEVEIQGRLGISRGQAYEYPWQIEELLRCHTERIEDSDPENSILSKFTGKGLVLTPKHRLERSSNQDRDVKYFRRTLNDEKVQIYYLFMRLANIMIFRAKGEPIR